MRPILAIILCLLPWRFYLHGPPPQDMDTIAQGWTAYAAGENPYAAAMGVNYPPAMQWLGGEIVRAVGLTAALGAFRVAMSLGCILGLIGVARLARVSPCWTVALGAAACPPILEGWLLGNPGPAIAGLGIYALAFESPWLLGLSLALKPLLAPAWLALLVIGRVDFAAISAISALVVTAPALGLTQEWLARCREWVPLWEGARGSLAIRPHAVPATAWLAVVGVALGLAARRWRALRRPEALAAGSLAALPVLWTHSLMLAVPVCVSSVAWWFRRRRPAVALVLVALCGIATPASAAWSKKFDGQWSNLHYLACRVWSTNGLYCVDTQPASATGMVKRVQSDYSVASYNGPSYGAGGNVSVTGFGFASSGTRMHMAFSSNGGSNDTLWNSTSATLSSWNSQSLSDPYTAIVGNLSTWGDSAQQYALSPQISWSPNRAYAIRFTTGDWTQGGNYGTGNLYANRTNGKVVGDGCARSSTRWDYAVATTGVAYVSYGQLKNDNTVATNVSEIAFSSAPDGAAACITDGSTTAISIRRRAATAHSRIIQQGAVSDTTDYAVDLVTGYAGTAFTGSSARFAISVAGVVYSATSGAFSDHTGTTLDLALDASDTVSGFGLAPDGTSPMVVTAQGDGFVWEAATAATRPRRTSLSGALGGSLGGSL